MVRSIATGAALAIVLTAGPLRAAPGDRDATFGNGGIVTTTFGGDDDSAEALVLQPDGKIVAVGSAGVTGGNHDVALARYDAAGGLDPSFGTGGRVTTDFGTTDDHAYAVALQADGKVVVAGTRFGLARYQVDGSLDPSFGTGGLVVPGGWPTGTAYAVLVQPDGGIVVAGGEETGVGTSLDAFVLARYLPDGTLDGSFGTGGLVTTDFGFSANRVQALVLQPDGRLVAAGQGAGPGPGMGSSFGLARYEVDGSLDASFGTAGLVRTNFFPGSFNDSAFALVLQPDGKLVAAGQTGQPVLDFGLARYDVDGNLDPTFGTGGLVTTSMGINDVAYGLALQPDGKVIAAGYEATNGGERFALLRYRADGTLDPSFGTGGQVSTIVAGVLDRVHGVALQPDGKVVVAGLGVGVFHPGFNDFTSTFALARYLGGECGNGAVEGGEDCDDGNLIDGDGCDAHCCVLDADGDGVCDARDPCTGPAAVARPKIILERLDTGVGDDRFTFQGQMTLPHPFAPPLDPLANGVRVLIDDLGGNVLDLTIPGGAYGGSPAVGWKANGTVPPTRWTYLDKRPIRPAGVNKVLVQDKSVGVPGLVKFVVKGKDWSYQGYANPPLAGVMVLDPPLASTGQCGQATFPGPHPVPVCALNGVGSKLICK